ncbi:uncharacterized protein EV420DRAFT_1023203 [Desarmillaria tabescens]|uniref:Heterokaryon incompatibility domain-containing protein n=1 Tax=Armillaria tabescens TaxID=1929756 RepID=A0AA39MR89_ARMTA|nr:uncharacterized protein EV420DRAFT_1023203 [Desarmillaria tabescens]KAK0443702.1 hypothetical protein EV420DRAFT_1023203 [Desarmillaria tabescens]
MYLPDEDEVAHLKYGCLPEVTISSLTETGRMESSIQVPLQRRYTSRKPVIPSSLANTPCADLGTDGLLDLLNTTLGTSYARNTTALSSLLESYITSNYDFGTAYAHLRPRWYDDLTTIKVKLHSREALDKGMRQDVLVDNRIIEPRVPPRRIWDLCSNRVVPWWIIRWRPWGISHAWMDEKDRSEVWTPINGREWPVPIPNDANLDLIRIEMLNLGAEYVWLDVLCLGQRGGGNDNLRKEEWRLDVPTIGWVYLRANKVVYYLSGLGRPLGFKAGDLGSDRCWFRRAWTLQEVSKNSVIAGDTGDEGNTVEEDVRARFHDQLSSLESMRSDHSVFDVLSRMQNRASTYPVDKVAGLAHLLQSLEIPAYCGTQSEEGAWTALVNLMSNRSHRGQMFFLYPEPGNGNSRWRPSWKQVMTEILPSTYKTLLFDGCLPQGMEDADQYEGYCIESAYVRGLSERDPQGQPRRGEFIAKDGNGTSHTFAIVATHQYPIPDGTYALICSDPYDGSSYKEGTYEFGKQYWVVGKSMPGQRFEKVSVFELNGSEQIKRAVDPGILKARPGFYSCGGILREGGFYSRICYTYLV